MKYVYAFIAEIFRDWIGRMSGGGGLLLTIFGFFSPAAWQPQLFLILGILCLVVACYRAWLFERSWREELIKEIAPRLQFVHKPGVKPFNEDFDNELPGVKVRRMRVGLHNRGATEIPQARLLLEACDPDSNFLVGDKLFNPSPAIHLEHELRPMGKPQGTPTVNIPSYGTVYFDVAREVVPEDQSSSKLSVCYTKAFPDDDLPPRDKTYKIVLRAEGAGPAIRCQMELGGRAFWRLDGLTILPSV